MSKKHYPWSPSASSRWTQCPGSVALCGSLPERPAGAAAAEGSLAHAYAECLLRGETWTGEPISEEMERHVRGYVEYCTDIPAATRFIEETLEHPTIPGFGGTADYMAVVKDGRETLLWIVDFKYGENIAVQAENNPQAVCYAILASAVLPKKLQPDRYRVTIYQPRTGGPPDDTWEFDRATFEEGRQRVLAAMQDDGHFSPGKHCVYCPAIAHCEALHESVVALAEDGKPSDEDLARWEEVMDLAPAIRALLAEVPERIEAAIRNGQTPARYKLVHTYGHRRWAGDEAATKRALMGRGLRKKDIVHEKLLTPPQLEKLGLLGVAEDLVVKPNAGHRVVPADDRRPAVTFNRAEDDFDDLEPLF